MITNLALDKLNDYVVLQRGAPPTKRHRDRFAESLLYSGIRGILAQIAGGARTTSRGRQSSQTKERLIKVSARWRNLPSSVVNNGRLVVSDW